MPFAAPHTNMIQLPGAGNGVSFRPAVVIPMFFGVAFGPDCGFHCRFVGNIRKRTCSPVTASGSEWDLGNGLLGLVQASFIPSSRTTKPANPSYWPNCCGAWLRGWHGRRSPIEMWVSGADMNTVIFANFLPAFIPDVVNGLVLVPLLMIKHAAVTQRSGRS